LSKHEYLPEKVLPEKVSDPESAKHPKGRTSFRGQTPFPEWMFWASMVLLAVCQFGCAAYQFGARSQFRDNIRTVYVPIARNDTFRNDLGPRLTEAVIRTIEMRTPFKVTGDPNADSTLTVRVTSESKRVLTETINDDPRALDALVTAQAVWTDRYGNSLLQNQLNVEGVSSTDFLQSERFVPEAGQSVETSLQASIEDLAERIVSQMENRW